LLVRHDADGWKWMRPGSQVYTNDPLVSLPGFRSEVRLDSGVHVLLRGMMFEFSRDPLTDFLLESAVMLHKNPDFDLDLTLDRGRIYLSNHKETGAARVRLRFGHEGSEIWDLTLHEPGTEVGIDLNKHYTREINYLDGEDPRMELVLQVLRGRAGLKVEAVHHPNLTPPPGPGLFAWDNKGEGVRGPFVIEKELPIWLKSPPTNPAANEMDIALKELSARMDSNKSPVLAVEESLGSDRMANRALAIYSLGAMDEVRRLMDVLGEDNPNLAPDREKIIFTLRRWISRNAEQSKILYDPKTKTGLLMAMQKYRPKEAERLSILLHDFTDEARRSPETYELLGQYLLSDKVAIAELAYWHLRHLAGGIKLPPFNAALPKDLRQPVADEVEKLIKDGKLPPPLPPPPGAGAPGTKPPMPPKQP
jgi:hypothetical protein